MTIFFYDYLGFLNFLNKLWYKAKIVRDKSHTL